MDFWTRLKNSMTGQHRFCAVLASFSAFLGASFDAWAAPTVGSCYGSYAPSEYSWEYCNDVCSVASVGILGYKASCYVDVYTYEDGKIVAVLDYEDDGDTIYSAWGNDTAGDEFCCAIYDPYDEIGFFYLYGSYVSDDELYYQQSSHSMQTPDGGTFLSFAYGSSGDDLIVGASETDSDYKEYLFGSYGADHIYGGDGSDYICGGGGSGSGDADFLKGEDGDDLIVSMFGGNSMLGGVGGEHIVRIEHRFDRQLLLWFTTGE